MRYLSPTHYFKTRNVLIINKNERNKYHATKKMISVFHQMSSKHILILDPPYTENLEKWSVEFTKSEGQMNEITKMVRFEV